MVEKHNENRRASSEAFMLNIHLQPVDDKFRSEVIRLSQDLCKQEGSTALYRLAEKPTTGIESWTHCTSMHFVVPNEKVLAEVKVAVAPFLGREIEVRPYGVLPLPNLPKWDRDGLITQGKKQCFPDFSHIDIWFLNLRMTQALRDLQQEVCDALLAEVQKVSLITGRGDDYGPHFTLMCRRKKMNGFAPMPISSVIPDMSPQLCRVAIGDCGPSGQVRRWVGNLKNLELLAA